MKSGCSEYDFTNLTMSTKSFFLGSQSLETGRTMKDKLTGNVLGT